MHNKYKCLGFEHSTLIMLHTQDPSHTTHKIHTMLGKVNFQKYMEHSQHLEFVNNSIKLRKEIGM
jgi:hypothetical protein